MGNTFQAEEEINLIDIIRVLIKKKNTILGVFLFSILLAVVISFALPKQYKSSFVLEIGSLGENLIDTPTNIKSKVEIGYVHSAMLKLNIPEEEFPKVEVENPKKNQRC